MEKTPEETKRGLKVCHSAGRVLAKELWCEKVCPYMDEAYGCGQDYLHADALAYIQQLEADNAELLTRCERLERERNAAVGDMTTVIYNGAEIVCQFCKHKDEHKCAQICGFGFRGFEWRGVEEG